MIFIDSILIENLRGIKRLYYDFGNGNLVIHGPNGSGKSGVIDAIEFVLTGTICRLSGIGTSGINLNTHAPHVDFRDNSRMSKVLIKLKNKLTGNTFTIERTVANSKKPTITPDNEEAQVVLKFLYAHPEFSLSRREILKFIVTEPSQRAKEVQELLKMDSIDKIRSVLNKLNNETKRTAKEKSANLLQAKTKLLNHLQLVALNKEEILNKVNDNRVLLGLEKINIFNPETKFSSNINNESQNKKRAIDKRSLHAQITKLLDKLNSPPAFIETLEAYKSLQLNPDFIQSVNKQNFYDMGINFIIDNFCPFCDTAYDKNLLFAHIKEKLEVNKKASSLHKIIQSGCASLKIEYNILIGEINDIKRDAFSLTLTEDAEKLVILSEKLKLNSELLDKPIDNLEKTFNLINTPYIHFDTQITTTLKNIFDFVTSLPDSSAEENAKHFLIITDERIEAYRLEKRQADVWEKRSKVTEKLLSIFENISETRLTKLYEEVEKEFSRLYSKINNDDEKDFNAQLTHSKGSLNFEVDFYGRGVFPPNAFHSEGHQDGMGLCLYLALSKRIMGDGFTFCLLDDVLMSVDTNHRREFCRLLKSEFPQTQFIITTHDEIWKKQLINEGVVNSKQVLHFRGWSVDNGPSYLNEKDILDELDTHIKNETIASAAPILRQYLEYIMSELSCKLRVKLEVTLNNSHDFGEISDAVIQRYKELLKKAKAAANTWNQKDTLEEIKKIDEKFNDSVRATKVEQWVLNPSVHYNEWANFTPKDFKLLKEAFFDLLNQFKCHECLNWIYVLPPKGSTEEIRCECGRFSLNFKVRKKE